MAQSPSSPEEQPPATRDLDAVIIGAGFGGLYALHRLRSLGLKLRVYDAAAGVGGTWWWNRYPGARVDFYSAPLYSYTFSEELVNEWNWTETQADQPSVLAYLNFVADKFDLRRDIQLKTRIDAAEWDCEAQHWHLRASDGTEITAKYVIGALGTLSQPYWPAVAGIGQFAGELYHTGRWPLEGVSFSGRRVAVIGSGASAVQSIPEIARTARTLTVFQRTPQYSIPARNRPLDPELVADYRRNWPRARDQMLTSPFGAPDALGLGSERSALDDTPEERAERFEKLWEAGGIHIFLSSYNDLLTNPEANDLLGEFVRRKIRETVSDPDTARKLLPTYHIGTKRLILDSGYFETFNRTNVELVSLAEEPIVEITRNGIRTETQEYEVDIIVLATGYDAMTGGLLALNPIGADGSKLSDEWADRARTYLGIAVSGFPNFFFVNGPHCPHVVHNLPLATERQVDWIAECIDWMRLNCVDTLDPMRSEANAWSEGVDAIASQTLFPLADSWYTGANIPGKPRQFTVHLDALGYFQALSAEARDGYRGFTRDSNPRQREALEGAAAATAIGGATV
jgi:cation diffusion facilitator CzcD-associated flavoprotein CzcO